MSDRFMGKHLLPRLDIKTRFNHSPHVVILGAGASRACCPNGDKSGQKLPVMADFVDVLEIAPLLKKACHDPRGNFEKIYSAIHATGNLNALAELDAVVRSYFGKLSLPDSPTLYDYLILSLREKDLIVTFNWDPLLPQAYRRWRHLGPVLPQLAFLHGNVDIGADVEKRVSGFLCDEPWPNRQLKPTSLLYPVAEKNYNDDPFIASQWSDATTFLSQAYYATVYGYSAPITDVEARTLLLKAWSDNRTRELAEIDIVDIREKKEVEASWADFIVRTHGGVSNSFQHNILRKHPRRSCEAFAFATLQQDPWSEDPIPDFQTCTEMEEWIRPLITEEKSGSLKGKPLH